MTTNHNDLFSDAAREVLADQCTPAVVRAIEAGGRTAGATAALWAQLEATGLADALLSEDDGGAGLGLGQVFGVLEQCGAHALPLPLGDTMVARALLARAGVARPAGSIALARGERLADGGLRCALVRSGQVAAAVLVQAGSEWRLLNTGNAQGTGQALALDATLTWTAAQVQAAPAVAVDAALDARTLQAAVVAAQMAGALSSVFQRTLQYANERQQFGRPIGKFQAIQHQLAVMSEHVFAARMAAQLGCSGAGVVPDAPARGHGQGALQRGGAGGVRAGACHPRCDRLHRRIRPAAVHTPPACLAPDGGQRSLLVRRGGRGPAGTPGHDPGHRAAHHRRGRGALKTIAAGA